MNELTKIDPVRSCCMQRHPGPICLDGMVQCCMCFSRYPTEELYVDDNGEVSDVCQDCGSDDAWASQMLVAIECALNSVYMRRGRGESVSDQSEALTVLRAVRKLAVPRFSSRIAD
jgi:hypothetical protein